VAPGGDPTMPDSGCPTVNYHPWYGAPKCDTNRRKRPWGGWPIGRPSWHLEMLFVGRAAPVVRHIFAISTMYIPHHSSSFLYNYRHAPSSVHANGAPAGRHWGWGCPPKKAPWANPQPARNIRDIFVPPPYGHDGSLRFVTVFAHNGAVPVRSQVIHNFQEHPLLFGRRRAFRKGFPPTGPSSTDRRR